jgi:hypothetical protein
MGSGARAQDQKKAAPEEPPKAKAATPAKPPENKVKELRVVPQPAPRPALRYRLLPLESDRTPGDAAPIYLRLRQGQRIDAAFQQIQDNHTAWINKPLGEFPVAEARKFVDGWQPEIEQLEFGARRRACDWNYTLPEQREHAIEILLPDAQEMHNWSRLLAIKARVEIAEQRYDDAVRTIETGLSFARHVAEGPFLINALVGIAIANVMLAQLEELIAQPDAPNLYWALTALPRPPISVRNALEVEQRLGENLVPEITDVENSRTDAEWSSLLVRLHDRLNHLAKTHLRSNLPASYFPKETDLTTFKAELVPQAREYLRQRRIVTGPETERLPEDHAIVLYIAEKYRDLRDDFFKIQYLPYKEADARASEAWKHVTAEKTGPVGVFAALVPAVMAGRLAEARLDRRIAALRVVEALRMHAAAHGGELPTALDQVTVAPIPLDPLSGKAFEYRREGGAAVLAGPTPPRPPLGLSYRITMRQ